MAINISDSFHAAAIVEYAVPGTPDFAGQNGFSGAPTDIGAGHFSLVLDQPVNQAARVISATPRGTVFANVVVEEIDDNTIGIRTFDAAGAALDNIPVDILVMRFSL